MSKPRKVNLSVTQLQVLKRLATGEVLHHCDHGMQGDSYFFSVGELRISSRTVGRLFDLKLIEVSRAHAGGCSFRLTGWARKELRRLER